MENEANKLAKNNQIHPVLIEEELKESFLDYAMSVVVSRAIPDVRDGLKPVHRRILYTMGRLGFYHNKPYHKSARIIGDVMGKFHPHGDQAIYSTMVGMVQPFSKRYPLLDGQGNWGSVDGDSAAAHRYTEVRMAKIAQELLADLDKETVDFVPNFDESTVEPTILPSKLPNFLLNGTSGIAVGMATSVPPHNLTEVINGCLALLSNPQLPDEKLFELIPAPDFPTGGIICGRGGIIKAYTTGRGSILVRGKVDVEETKKGEALIITDLPYQVNKAELIIKIADLVKSKIIEGITNIRDESDRKGNRVVIDIKKGEEPQLILNLLYKHTQLQTSSGILMLALLDNRPIVFTLRRILEEFLQHRQVIITKRCQYDLDKARAREHILLGFTVALANIDDIVELIKKSQNGEEATEKLSVKYGFTPEQSKAILDLRLQRLTGLEQEKIRAELDEIKILIGQLQAILSDNKLLREEVRKELEEIKLNYGDERKTSIEGPVDILTEVDLIPDEEMVVTLTKKGYVKRVPLEIYDVQHRGGKGKMGMATLEDTEDMLQDIYVTKTHDDLLFFTNLGRVYNMKVYQLPEGSRISKGRAIVNILPLTQDEHVVKLLCTSALQDQYLVMLTKHGLIKRTKTEAFKSIRSNGIRAITLNEDDQLVFCALSSGSSSIVIASALGQGIRFNESEVRSVGRQAAGVIGIRLREGDEVVGMEIINNDKDILFVTEQGYGKRVRICDFRIAHRGGFGVRTIPTSKRNGHVVGLVVVDDNADVLLIDNTGKIIRLLPSEIRTMGRQAQGVRLIKLAKDHFLAGVAAVPSEGSSEESEESEEQETEA